jgi:hypothetical protein
MRARLEGPSRSMGQLTVAVVAGGAMLAKNAVVQSSVTGENPKEIMSDACAAFSVSTSISLALFLC